MKSVLTETLGQMIQEQMSKTDKYRHDCIHCVKVLDVPMTCVSARSRHFLGE